MFPLVKFPELIQHYAPFFDGVFSTLRNNRAQVREKSTCPGGHHQGRKWSV